MKTWILASLTLSLGCVVQAQDRGYETGTLVRMDSAKCGYAENDGKPIAGEIPATDAKHKKTEEVLCQEYVIQTDKINYRIRPKEGKHTFLLPIGQTAEFRIHRDKMQLRMIDSKDTKERDFIVVSMSTRTDAAVNQSAVKSQNP